MGLGKTKITLDIISYRKLLQPNYCTLVVCPNTLIDNWEDESLLHSELSCIKLTGHSNRRRKLLFDTSADVYVINYESVRILYKDLIKKGFNLIVLDESQNVKNPQSKQSKACYEISCRVKHKLILTGTPIMNNPLELFGQYKILNDSIFGTNFYRFRARHAVMGGYLNKQPIQWINMKDLKEKVYSCATRMTKKECLDLPDKLYEVVRLDMTEDQKRVYKDLKEQFISDYNENLITAHNMLTRLARFAQLTAGFVKDDEGTLIEVGTSPKIKWLLEFLADSDSKVVVFCRFHKETDMIRAALTKAGYKHVWIDGRVDKSERQDIIKEFNSDDETRVFIGGIKATGVGVNLTSASYTVFMSNDFSYGVRSQAEDRIHRIGQDKNCTYIDLVCRNTIDTAVYNALKKKKSISDAIIDTPITRIIDGE